MGTSLRWWHCTYLSQRNFLCHWLRPEILALGRSLAAGVLKETNRKCHDVLSSSDCWAHWWFSPLLVSFSHHFLRESFPIKISWQKPKSSLCNELQLAKIPCAILLGVWRKRPPEVAINTEPVNNNFQCSQGTLCLPSSPGTPAPRSWAWVCKCHFSVTATEILNKNDQYRSLDHSHPLPIQTSSSSQESSSLHCMLAWDQGALQTLNY